MGTTSPVEASFEDEGASGKRGDCVASVKSTTSAGSENDGGMGFDGEAGGFAGRDSSSVSLVSAFMSTSFIYSYRGRVMDKVRRYTHSSALAHQAARSRVSQHPAARPCPAGNAGSFASMPLARYFWSGRLGHVSSQLDKGMIANSNVFKYGPALDISVMYRWSTEETCLRVGF